MARLAQRRQADIGADEFYCYPLTEVSLAGPPTGITDTATTFTATVSLDGHFSRHLHLQASGLAPVTHTWFQLSDAAVFSCLLLPPKVTARQPTVAAATWRRMKSPSAQVRRLPAGVLRN